MRVIIHKTVALLLLCVTISKNYVVSRSTHSDDSHLSWRWIDRSMIIGQMGHQIRIGHGSRLHWLVHWPIHCHYVAWSSHCATASVIVSNVHWENLVVHKNSNAGQGHGSRGSWVIVINTSSAPTHIHIQGGPKETGPFLKVCGLVFLAHPVGSYTQLLLHLVSGTHDLPTWHAGNTHTYTCMYCSYCTTMDHTSVSLYAYATFVSKTVKNYHIKSYSDLY